VGAATGGVRALMRAGGAGQLPRVTAGSRCGPLVGSVASAGGNGSGGGAGGGTTTSSSSSSSSTSGSSGSTVRLSCPDLRFVDALDGRPYTNVTWAWRVTHMTNGAVKTGIGRGGGGGLLEGGLGFLVFNRQRGAAAGGSSSRRQQQEAAAAGGSSSRRQQQQEAAARSPCANPSSKTPCIPALANKPSRPAARPLNPEPPHPPTPPPTRLPEGDYVAEVAVGAFGQAPKSENTLVFLSTTLTVSILWA